MWRLVLYHIESESELSRTKTLDLYYFSQGKKRKERSFVKKIVHPTNTKIQGDSRIVLLSSTCDNYKFWPFQLGYQYSYLFLYYNRSIKVTNHSLRT